MALKLARVLLLPPGARHKARMWLAGRLLLVLVVGHVSVVRVPLYQSESDDQTTLFFVSAVVVRGGRW